MILYKNSKTLPLSNYMRIEEDGNFLYMIKGYDETEEYDEEVIEKCKEQYNEVIQDLNLTLNEKSEELKVYADITFYEYELYTFEILKGLIIQNLARNELARRLGEIEYNIVKYYIANIKIPKSDDLREQLKYIEERIKGVKNRLEKAKSEKKTAEFKGAKITISQELANVEMILGFTIDVEKTSFGYC